MRGTHTQVALFLLLTLVPGCVGTPLPDPPAIDRDALESYRHGGDATLVVGTPGAVSVPFSHLSLWNLTDTSPAEQVVTDAEGAFRALVPGIPFDPCRLQAAYEGQRSVPVDVVWEIPETTSTCLLYEAWSLCPFRPDQESCEGFSIYCEWVDGACEGQGPATTPECSTATTEASCASLGGCIWGSIQDGQAQQPMLPLEDCLHLTPTLELDLRSGETGVVDIHSECTSDVELTFSLRSGGVGFSLAPDPGMIIIAPDASDVVSITYAPPGSEIEDDILYVEVASPEVGRRAITLHGLR